MSPLTVVMAAYAKAVKGLTYTEQMRASVAYFGRNLSAAEITANKEYFAQDKVTGQLKSMAQYHLTAMHLPSAFFGGIDMRMLTNSFCEHMQTAVKYSLTIDRFGDSLSSLTNVLK